MANYPIPVFHFEVDWGGTKSAFNEISGIGSNTIQSIDYREGTSTELTNLKIPGLQETAPITLKRGIFKADNEFYEWWNSVQYNTIERRDITITLLDESNQPVMVWKAKNAWPTKVEDPNLNAQTNEIAFESIEVVHEGIVIANS